jgi:pilus assembly protein Flp/PilA
LPIELTALKFSDHSVPSMVTVLRTPRDQTSFDSHVHPMEFHIMKNLVSRFVKNESGATAIEYGLIAAGISLAIIAVVNGLGTTLNTKFTSINTSLK